jgi:RimJ/RimL family protein N-acetyltransferase
VTTSPPATGFSVKPVLTGGKVVLRPYRAADAPVIAEIIGEPEVRRYTDTRGTFTPDQIRAAIVAHADAADRLDLAVTDAATGELVGEVVLNEWDEPNRSCNFRTLLGPRGRDRGLGTEATRLIVGYGFEQLHLHRISLEVFSFNPRARRVYEKVGFVVEGVERETLLVDGQWADSVRMAILDWEWAGLAGTRQAF